MKCTDVCVYTMTGSHCLQCSIDKLQVKKSTAPNAGKGLFYVGKTDLKPKTKVTLYSSKEITRKRIKGDYVLPFLRPTAASP